jgi:hypothetical protein
MTAPVRPNAEEMRIARELTKEANRILFSYGPTEKERQQQVTNLIAAALAARRVAVWESAAELAAIVAAINPGEIPDACVETDSPGEAYTIGAIEARDEIIAALRARGAGGGDG